MGCWRLFHAKILSLLNEKFKQSRQYIAKNQLISLLTRLMFRLSGVSNCLVNVEKYNIFLNFNVPDNLIGDVNGFATYL